MESDLYANLPSGVTLHTARMHLTETTPAGERAMIQDYLPRAAEDLASARPHLVVFGCTSAGALLGAEGERRMLNGLRETCAAPVVSVVESVQAVLQSRGWNRVAVLTPYVAELNRPIQASLERIGITVAAVCGLGISENFAIAGFEPEDICRRAVEQFRSVKADGVFVSCTNFRGMAALPLIEQALDLPGVSSNLCVLEAVRERLEINGGAGREGGR